MKETVLIIDMLNMYVRNFSAFAITNDDGDLVSGIYGSLASIRSSIEKHKPDHVVIAWEGEQSAERRRKTLVTYKEGRKFTGLNRKYFEYSAEDERDSFTRQLLLLKDCLDDLPVTQFAIKYLEADDVIAYLCKKVLNNYNKIVISNDKDYFQIVDESTTIFRPVKTKENPNGEYIDMDWMVNNEKCFPHNYILVKALAGCTSDKIPGIDGVGEKSVKRDFPFLEEHTEFNVDSIIDHAKNNVKKNKKYQKYIDHETLLRNNETIVQLVDPDISVKSVDTIYNVIERGGLKFNPYKFRVKLLSEGISPSNIDNWIGTFATIKTTKISLNDGE
jgi:5'-3' exonuclease|tara:strand:- start:1189 stop:2184 length:996 start_codon:yes stop_codon:yes gene_type:complete